MAKKVFYFHYNKPASISAGKPQLSVHFGGSCFIVDAIDCRVPVRSKNNKRQPHCVMRGVCDTVRTLIVQDNGGQKQALIS